MRRIGPRAGLAVAFARVAVAVALAMLGTLVVGAALALVVAVRYFAGW